jgi:hypothetical protein
MELVLTPSTVNESNPVSIHKIIDDELVLMPGDKTTISVLVFPRRTGLQTLKGFKVFDRQLKGDREHEAKGYAFSFPKFTIVDN